MDAESWQIWHLDSSSSRSKGPHHTPSNLLCYLLSQNFLDRMSRVAAFSICTGAPVKKLDSCKGLLFKTYIWPGLLEAHGSVRPWLLQGPGQFKRIGNYYQSTVIHWSFSAREQILWWASWLDGSLGGLGTGSEMQANRDHNAKRNCVCISQSITSIGFSCGVRKVLKKDF